MPETHPEVYAEFKKGGFSIKRTKKSFSGSPIDLTLEQTINADAASQRTGIASLTNSISARQRWAESHFLRSSVISHVFEDLQMSKKEDTGKAASEKTVQFLLNVAEIGKKRRFQFINECIEDPSRVESRIQQEKVYTFASDAGKRKLQGSDGKVVAACLVRDLFGSILYHSLKQEIDMAEVLKYPLTPVPLSLSHVDGTMQKTPKAVLLKHLESQVTTTPQTSVNTTTQFDRTNPNYDR